MKFQVKLGVTVGVVLVFLAVLFAINGNSNTQTAQIKRGNLLLSTYGIGTIKSDRRYDLKIGVSSNIENLFVKEGDFVEKGQALLNLSNIGLFKSPISGVVTKLNFSRGESVFAQKPILSVVNFNNRYVLVALEQSGALKVKPNQRAHLSFEGFREESFIGTVRSIYSSGDRLLARIDIKNLPKNILPGMTADIGIIINELKNILLVPVVAVKLGKIKLSNGEKIEVEIGASDGTQVQIISDKLEAGQKVLIDAPTGA